MNIPGGMSPNTIQILLAIQANQQAAQQSQKALTDTKKAIDDVDKSASKLKTSGRELREVGGYIAAGGAAMLAPFILAANTYEQKYKGLEPIANNYALAQRKQADATVQLGRVAAQALTPFLNQVADVEKKIADFASAHPDIVQAVVGGGAVLAGVGAAMVAAGQAMVTIANAAKLLQGGNLLGNLSKGIVGIAAFGLALEATTDIIHKIGKDTNDQFLATFDPLKTFRELLVEAASTVNQLAAIFKVVGAQFDIGIQNLIIGIAQALKNIGVTLPGTEAQGQGPVLPGQTGPTYSPQQLQIARDQAYIVQVMSDAQKYQQQNIATPQTLQFVETGQLSGGASDVINQLTTKLSGLLGGFGGTTTTTATGTSTDVSASVNAYIKYLQQVKQADIQYGLEKVRIATEYNNETSKIEKDRATEAVQIARDRANQVQQLDQEQERAKVKRLEDFNHNEAMTEERLRFERQQKLYEMSLQANELAVQGDVAGFIAAQQQNRIQVMEQEHQNAFDKKQRQEQFDYEQKQQDKADQVARDQQKRQFAIEDQDRRAQYQKEDADRRTAYDNQLQALQVSHQNQQDEMQRAFVQQLADLEDNVAGLHTIQLGAYAQQASDFQTFSNQMTTKWQNLYTNLLGIGSPAPPTQNITPSPGGSFFASGGTLTPGWNVVGERGPEWIHGASGRVVPMQRSSGGASISISMPITIEGGSGGITAADLKAWGEQIVMHVGTTIQREASAL